MGGWGSLSLIIFIVGLNILDFFEGTPIYGDNVDSRKKRRIRTIITLSFYIFFIFLLISDCKFIEQV